MPISKCGSQISEAHFWRNVARELLAKNKTLDASGKAATVFAAREALTKSLEQTPEGRALLSHGAVIEDATPKTVDEGVAIAKKTAATAMEVSNERLEMASLTAESDMAALRAVLTV